MAVNLSDCKGQRQKHEWASPHWAVLWRGAKRHTPVPRSSGDKLLPLGGLMPHESADVHKGEVATTSTVHGSSFRRCVRN
jgi:hypothetical protein